MKSLFFNNSWFHCEQISWNETGSRNKLPSILSSIIFNKQATWSHAARLLRRVAKMWKRRHDAAPDAYAAAPPPEGCARWGNAQLAGDSLSSGIAELGLGIDWEWTRRAGWLLLMLGLSFSLPLVLTLGWILEWPTIFGGVSLIKGRFFLIYKSHQENTSITHQASLQD